MDDIRVYSAAIPASQIKEQYYLGLNNLLANGGINRNEYQKMTINAIDNIAKDDFK